MNFFEAVWSIILVIGRFFLLIFLGFSVLMAIFSLKDGEYGVTVISVIMFLLLLWAYIANLKKRKNRVA